MPRYFLKLAYKGSNYHGWQKQDNAHTVQQELESALSALIGTTTETVGCGRTDTGVHAREFYTHFDSENALTDKNFFIYKLNKILPPDISAASLFTVHPNANARFDALSRSYHYQIARRKNPFELDFSYYLYGVLDIGKMNSAAKLLFDHEDFSSFSKSNTQVVTNNCKIYKAEWYQKDDLLLFEIKANRFLRNMVRAIVGTLIQVGRGEITEAEFSDIIASKNRSRAGFSVPAEGLFLTQVDYPDTVFIE
jgi:tRNA pseudouridine38-40 synthase